MTAGHRDTSQFDATEVRQALRHLNRCHPAENLRMARLAEVGTELTGVWLAGLDGAGLDLLAESAQGPLVLRLDFTWPAASLTEAGEELRRLYRAACRLSD